MINVHKEDDVMIDSPFEDLKSFYQSRIWYSPEYNNNDDARFRMYDKLFINSKKISSFNLHELFNKSKSLSFISLFLH